MQLIYVDETGTGYERNITYPNYFTDGPFAIWVGIYVSENKFDQIERAFFELVAHYSEVSLNNSGECHAADIMKHENKQQVRDYFGEVGQLIAKMGIPITVGIQQKNILFAQEHKTSEKENELYKARHCFLHSVEHKLAELDQKGLLIADDELPRMEELNRKQLLKYKRAEFEKLQLLVNERQQWKTGRSPISRIRPKYIFEYRTNFIIDQLHYVRSKDSLLVQLTDNIAYCIRRYLEYTYLTLFNAENRPTPIRELCPIDDETMNLMASRNSILAAYYYEQLQDVMFTQIFESMPGSLREITIYG
jgi:hypothetical protein